MLQKLPQGFFSKRREKHSRDAKVSQRSTSVSPEAKSTLLGDPKPSGPNPRADRLTGASISKNTLFSFVRQAEV